MWIHSMVAMSVSWFWKCTVTMYESITGGSWGKVYKNSLDFLLISNYQPVSKLKIILKKILHAVCCSLLQHFSPYRSKIPTCLAFMAISKQHKVIILHFWKFISLKCSWFSVLWYFILYSKVIQLFIYIQSFSYSFSLWFIIRCWLEFPMLYSRPLFFIYPIYTSLHLLIPNSQTIPPPFIFSVLGNSYKIFHYEE